MSRSSRLLCRAAAVAVTCAVTALGFAGCLDDAHPPLERDGTAASGHAVTLLMSGLDAPEAGDDHSVALTIGHIGLYDADRHEWVPLLTRPMHVTIHFGDTSRTTVDTFAIVEGNYTEVELLVDAAMVIGPSGTDPATVDEAVCYTPIRLDLTAQAPPERLELWLSGAEALRGAPHDWTVRPALVGSATDEPDIDPPVVDVECTEA